MNKALNSLTTEIESNDFSNYHFLIKLPVEILPLSEEKLRGEEEKLLKDLEQLQEKEKYSEIELKKLSEEIKQLTEEEEKYWSSFNMLERDIYLYNKEKCYTKKKIDTYEKEIKSFASNVINDLFSISYSGSYGTINGSRMGMDSGNNIPCDEINAGFGYIVHLTTIIARKINYAFKR